MKGNTHFGPINIEKFSQVSRRLFYLEYLQQIITETTSSIILKPMQDMTEDERGQYMDGLYEILTEDLTEEGYLKRAKMLLDQMKGEE